MNIDELIEQLKQLSISQEEALQTQREVGSIIAKKSVAAEREACAKVVEKKWAAFEELKAAHYRQTSEPFDPFRYHEDLGVILMSRDLAAAIRARGNE